MLSSAYIKTVEGPGEGGGGGQGVLKGMGPRALRGKLALAIMNNVSIKVHPLNAFH